MKYNTDINIVGGIPDFHLIYQAYPLLVEGKGEEAFKSLVTENEYELRTEKSRKRFLSVVQSAFITDSKEINELAKVMLNYFSFDEKSQALILFWLFSINNHLFYRITRDVFLKSYFQGRAELPADDVLAYIKDLFQNDEELKGKWSENTIKTVASKYLTLMKKLYLVEGSRRKTFCFVRISDELLALFIHFYSLRANKSYNFLEDEFSVFSFVPKENLLERVKKVGKKNWVNMNYTGNALNVEGVFNPNNIIDGIYRRS